MSRLTTALVLVFSMALVGCGGNLRTSSAPDPLIRFINGVPDSTALDFLIDDTENDRIVTVGNNVAYLGSNADFSVIEPGFHDLILKVNGAPEEIWAETLDMQSDRAYVTVAFGLLNFGTEFEKRARIFSFQVDRTRPNGEKARLYVFHGFNRATGFDTPAFDFQTPGENPLFRVQDIAYGTMKELTVDSGPITLQARNKGTEFVFVEATPNLVAGGIYVALISGVEDAVGTQAPRITFIQLRAR